MSQADLRLSPSFIVLVGNADIANRLVKAGFSFDGGTSWFQTSVELVAPPHTGAGPAKSTTYQFTLASGKTIGPGTNLLIATRLNDGETKPPKDTDPGRQ